MRGVQRQVMALNTALREDGMASTSMDSTSHDPFDRDDPARDLRVAAGRRPRAVKCRATSDQAGSSP